MSDIDIGELNGSDICLDFIGSLSPEDIYKFSRNAEGSFSLSRSCDRAGASVQLLDSAGTVLHSGTASDSTPGAIDVDNLADPRLFCPDIPNHRRYELPGKSDLSGDGFVDPLTGLDVESGFFVVGNTGEVGIDFVYDGGEYQGELGFFSIKGMENLQPGSLAFIKEAAQRALSNSVQGHVAIADSDFGAKFSGDLGEEDFNEGNYEGVKTFAMTPGDVFGVMLVPNGTVKEVFNNPGIGDEKRPLFSLATGNPNEAFHLGQVADLTGDGKAFVMEDMRVDTGSDKDYNDVIFKFTGATGKAVALDKLIDPQKDWRSSELGKQLISYVTPDQEVIPPPFVEPKPPVLQPPAPPPVLQPPATVPTPEPQAIAPPPVPPETQAIAPPPVLQPPAIAPAPVPPETPAIAPAPVPSETPAIAPAPVPPETPAIAPPPVLQPPVNPEPPVIPPLVLPPSPGTPLLPENLLPSDEPEPIDPNQPLIGAIDSGVAANNPDLDYNRIILGSDRVDGDDNPLLGTGEGDEHGTHILGIIAAKKSNDIGIDGVNDAAPVWVGRSLGTGEWADSLVEFVDAAIESQQENAIANLSLDLTQINPDGTVTTRSELTAEERAALEYARQNKVLIVVAAGNDGGEMSALGKASQEFDNIITVGSSEGTGRATYSSYGYGLDLLALGGTADNPVLSTMGEDVGTHYGTSVATALVTGAASQVWAANPQLNYRQVIDILKSTATDLNTTGWDTQTGTGLLNLDAAVNLAKTTTPEPYSSLGVELLQSVLGKYQIPEVLLPAFAEVYSYVDVNAKLTEPSFSEAGEVTPRERAVGFLDDVGNVLEGVGDTISDGIDSLGETVTDVVGGIGDTATNFLDGLFGGYNVWDGTADTGGNWWDSDSTWVADTWDKAENMGSNWWNGTDEQVSGTLGSASNWFNGIQSLLGPAGGNIASGINAALGAAGTIANANDLRSLGGSANEFVGEIFSKPQGASQILNNIGTTFQAVQESPDLLWSAVEQFCDPTVLDGWYAPWNGGNNTGSEPVELSGTIVAGDGTYPINLWQYGSEGKTEAAIDPNKETVVVIHGWNRDGKENPFGSYLETLATTLGSDSNLQVLALDWGEAAIDSGILGKALPINTTRRIRPVAEWAAQKLDELGIDPSQITLFGHSFGSYVSAEIGKILGGVKNIVAMDPGFPSLVYDMDGRANAPGRQAVTDFNRAATNSLAFFAGHSFLSGGLAGDATRAATADDSFPIRFSGANPITRIWEHHNDVVGVVNDALQSDYLTVPDLLTLPEYQNDWYGHKSEKLNSSTPGHHEGVVSARKTGETWDITGLKYMDLSGEEETIWS